MGLSFCVCDWSISFVTHFKQLIGCCKSRGQSNIQKVFLADVQYVVRFWSNLGCDWLSLDVASIFVVVLFVSNCEYSASGCRVVRCAKDRQVFVACVLPQNKSLCQ